MHPAADRHMQCTGIGKTWSISHHDWNGNRLPASLARCWCISSACGICKFQLAPQCMHASVGLEQRVLQRIRLKHSCE